jgi:hypothetical protein
MVACAALPTGNDDGSTGSAPVRSTASSAASDCPAARHISASARLAIGSFMSSSMR